MDTNYVDEQKLAEMETALAQLTAMMGGSGPERWSPPNTSSEKWGASGSGGSGLDDGRLESVLLTLVKVLTTLNSNITTLTDRMNANGATSTGWAYNGQTSRYDALLAKHKALQEKYNELREKLYDA